MEEERPSSSRASWRQKLWVIIFEADTPAGKAFDVALLVCIMASILAVVMESVESVRNAIGDELRIIEWILTILFTIEYAVRLATSARPLRYARSFLGIIDVLAILPTYLSLFLAGSQALLVIRALRLLRVFRVLKIYRYFHEVDALVLALKRSRVKVFVFLLAVGAIVLIMGSVMYVVEGEESGFTSIPKAMYWAVVTVTTVGYGDIAPQTVPGQVVAAISMILGYSIIIVPTGVFSHELSHAVAQAMAHRICPRCHETRHDSDALHCKFCGNGLESTKLPD